jgi:hypothetical protein
MILEANDEDDVSRMVIRDTSSSSLWNGTYFSDAKVGRECRIGVVVLAGQWKRIVVLHEQNLASLLILPSFFRSEAIGFLVAPSRHCDVTIKPWFDPTTQHGLDRLYHHHLRDTLLDEHGGVRAVPFRPRQQLDHNPHLALPYTSGTREE